MDFELKIEVRELPISEIVENRGQIPDVPKNPRKISKERFDALCESIRMSPEMKVLDEVRVYPYDGKYVVIGGNHRFRAYKTLGWKNVLCKVLPEDTPKEKLREYVIKDNMQYAENDTRLLSDWNVKELVAWDVPMAIKKGKGAENVGGCAAYRNRDREKEQLEMLQQKWGGKIVKIDTSNKGRSQKEKRLDYNPIIKVPINGV